ncbi:CD1108 family mobile element protein [uncultured Eubacterium sp.]|uniref:C40 family peptidase n=1 Tax=uncultured Eubacterium sp. TaxID=165185 RepID=UPI0025953D0A|nr:NlpC/P60 family protein [uncultured Eubacterium sp.]
MAGREFKTKKKTAWNRKKDVLTSEESAQGKRDSRKRKQQAYRFQRASESDQEETSDREQPQKELHASGDSPKADQKTRYKKEYQKASQKKLTQSQVIPESEQGQRFVFETDDQMPCRAGSPIRVGDTLSRTSRFLFEKSQTNEDGEAPHPEQRAGEASMGAIRQVSVRADQIRHKKLESENRSKFLWKDSKDPDTGRQSERQKASDQADGKKQAWKKKQQKKRMQSGTWQKWKITEPGTGYNPGKTRRFRSVKEKVRQIPEVIPKKNRALLLPVGILLLLLVILVSFVGSCAVTMQGAGSLIGMTSYVSSDETIHTVEDYYAGLEDKLNQQINSMEKKHPGYDEYRYQVDEISHNPYHLISYLTAKYQEFTFAQVKEELDELFQAQYTLSTKSSTETVTKTKTVKVGESLGTVVTSGYCNCVICCGKWSGGVTASGVKPTSNHTLAVDAKNPIVPLGTKVIMNGIEYTVEDTGNFAKYGVDFDVYYDTHLQALAHGHKKWEAYLADSNGTKEVTTTVTTTKKIYSIQLTNHSFQDIVTNRMNRAEKKLYEALNATYGNRSYLFDITTLPAGGSDGFRYEIPPEALSDERFARMIQEAEKYLGMPYVWGGDSPQTGFDCSGFVSWVVNHSENGWDMGRQTANGLMSQCTAVSAEDAKPGDLVFFEKTYQTDGASHVGIYVGNGMMIHCGNPIQYTNINTTYWQQHFLGFGRLP